MTEIESLAAREIAFFERRLVSEADWRRHVEQATDALLCRRVRDLVDGAAFERAIETATTGDVFSHGVAPIAAEIQRRTAAGLREDDTLVGEYVPETAREKIHELLGRPKVVPEKVLRQFLEQDAVEELLRDVLYDAIKEFNEKVNPFFAEWGLAGLVRKLPGLRLVARSMDNVRAEFDRRLDPEIRKFLQGFSRRALRKLADTAVGKSDDPKFVALRRTFVAWAYEQPLRDFAGLADDEGAARVRAIAFEIAEHVLALEPVRARRQEAVSGLLAEYGDRTLGEALRGCGVTARPDFDALAAATWPQARAILESPASRAYMGEIVREFFAEEQARRAGG